MEEIKSRSGIGYGNPPTQNRFQKGRSGNPSGRPRGSVGIKSAMRKALLADGRSGQTILEELFDDLIEAARGGDRKVAAQLIALAMKLDPDDPPPHAADVDGSHK
jgi:Family of unknown function (DUF5681)